MTETANVLDLITLKKILLNGSAEEPATQTDVPVYKTETGLVTTEEELDSNTVKTATYVDSYEKMTDLANSLSQYKVRGNELLEKYDKSFFEDHSIAIFISSGFSYNELVESTTVKDGVLTVNAFGKKETLMFRTVSYMAVVFTRDDVSKYNITSAEYKPTEVKTCLAADIDVKDESQNYCSEESGWYKWIYSSKELNDQLDLLYTDEKSYSKSLCDDDYNDEFFKTNCLLLYNDKVECPYCSVKYDEKLIDVSITTDPSNETHFYLISVPKEVGKDKKTVFDISERSCVDKPVIYLYPKKETEVSVSVDLKGRFNCVYPEFTDEERSMWTVTASPDGLLRTEDGAEYNYLFWEGIQDVDWDMSKGFVVKGSDTLSFLRNQLPKMGLTPKEYNDFIVYWLPQMQNNEYNYITFQTDKYTDNAVLKVTPDADSVLRVFIAYTPVNKEEAQILSQSVNEPKFNGFERNGFTVVEWGGCIIH